MDNAKRCRFWTNTTLTLLLIQIGLVVLTSILLKIDIEGQKLPVLSACWLIAIVLHYANFRLTRTGFQPDRYEYTRSLLNHSDSRLRLLFHLLINWMVILLTVGVAWSMKDGANSQVLAWIVIVSSLLVWISFNLQHKKVNRRKNILVTSVISITLIILAFPLL